MKRSAVTLWDRRGSSKLREIGMPAPVFARGAVLRGVSCSTLEKAGARCATRERDLAFQSARGNRRRAGFGRIGGSSLQLDADNSYGTYGGRAGHRGHGQFIAAVSRQREREREKEKRRARRGSRDPRTHKLRSYARERAIS